MEAVLILAVLVAVLLLIAYRLMRSREILDAWVAREGHELVSAHRAWFWRGPFWLRSNQGQDVFRVVVRDERGRRRRGYVRVGGWFFGILSNEVAVRWDEES